MKKTHGVTAKHLQRNSRNTKPIDSRYGKAKSEPQNSSPLFQFTIQGKPRAFPRTKSPVCYFTNFLNSSTFINLYLMLKAEKFYVTVAENFQRVTFHGKGIVRTERQRVYGKCYV